VLIFLKTIISSTDFVYSFFSNCLAKRVGILGFSSFISELDVELDGVFFSVIGLLYGVFGPFRLIR
jgi:hypothetical protein